ncbi:hypothetical protein [Neptunicella marina]|uniref:Outer membrane lipoprotein-sorting protein n=1 Tax=Neptunicella marina TaxID=2125989 RepID=A0A8J6IJP6_9ALTE|nr:hypothetical protein [Neptunicella marina]MBC3764425.1 hypothetical protein [Neptunicella marina]
MLVKPVIIVLLSLVVLPLQAQQQLAIEGIAKDPDKGQVLYRESLKITTDSKQRLVDATVSYFYTDDKAFAIKSLTYGDEPLMPDLIFNDFRNDSQTQVRHDNKQLYVNYRIKDELTSKKLPLPSDKPVVVDAGFERLIQQYWLQLVAGNAISFYFLAIDRAKLVEFTLSKLNQSADTVVFEIKPDSFWVSLVVDPITLVFDKQQRLLRFSGLTNIAALDDTGQVANHNYQATIQYRYP